MIGESRLWALLGAGGRFGKPVGGGDTIKIDQRDHACPAAGHARDKPDINRLTEIGRRCEIILGEARHLLDPIDHHGVGPVASRRGGHLGHDDAGAVMVGGGGESETNP